MTEIRDHVVAIGNAIVDIIGRCDDTFLAVHGAPEGHMRLVDADAVSALYKAMGPGIEINPREVRRRTPGRRRITGRPRRVHRQSRRRRARPHLPTRYPRGRRRVLYRLGSQTRAHIPFADPGHARRRAYHEHVPWHFHRASTTAGPDPAVIRSAAIVYLEGYLFDRPEAKSAFRRAVAIAKGEGRRVALSLRTVLAWIAIAASSWNSFAPASTLCSPTKARSNRSTRRKASMRPRAAPPLTCRWRPSRAVRRGSLILSGSQSVEIPVDPVATVVDTTGAGDLYAAGVLFGLAKELPLETAGKLGSLAAAEIISHVGARPKSNLAGIARERGLIH